MTSWARVYDAAVLDPLAEQLVELAGISVGMRAVDVLAGSGRLTRRLVGCVGPLGRVTAVEDGDAAAALRDELHGLHIDAAVVAAAAELPFEDSCFDAALSLLGITAARGGVPALEEMARVARRVSVLVPRQGALEDALHAAFRTGLGDAPAQLLAAWGAPPRPAAWAAQVVSDVARFDSVAQLLRAVVERYGLSLSQDVADAVDAPLAAALAAYTGADGTVRVPVQATLMQTPVD